MVDYCLLEQLENKGRRKMETLSEEEKQFLIRYLHFKIHQTKSKLKGKIYTDDWWKSQEKKFKKRWKDDLRISENLLKRLEKIEKITFTNASDISDIIASKVVKEINIQNKLK